MSWRCLRTTAIGLPTRARAVEGARGAGARRDPPPARHGRRTLRALQRGARRATPSGGRGAEVAAHRAGRNDGSARRIAALAAARFGANGHPNRGAEGLDPARRAIARGGAKAGRGYDAARQHPGAAPPGPSHRGRDHDGQEPRTRVMCLGAAPCGAHGRACAIRHTIEVITT